MSVSLLDIGRLKTTVDIRGVQMEVVGLSARDLFRLLDMFPELRRMFGGVDVRPEQLFAQAPDAITRVIAYVLDYREIKLTEIGTETSSDIDLIYQRALESIDNLTIGEQTDIVKAAWDLTFPRGIKSFFDALEAMGVAPESIKAPGTTSQGRSSNSLPQDTEQTTSGDTPPDS